MVLMQLHIFLQIVFEMLPVSSSGNITLLFQFLSHLQPGVQPFVMRDQLDFLLHGSAVIVVGLYFFKPWLEYLISFLRLEKKGISVALFSIIADCVTAGFYFLFKVTGTKFFPLWLGFFITGAGLASLKWLSSKTESSSRTNLYKKKRAILLGITQGLALLPGVSRFGSTFVVARWLGFKNMQALKVSFLIAWPLMLVGSLKGFWELNRAGKIVQLLHGPVLFSIVIATVLSWFVLHWVARLINRDGLWKLCWWLWFLAIVAFFVAL